MDLGAIMMTYGNVYVAQVAMGADNAQPVAVLTWADAAGEHTSDDLIANPPVVHMD